LEGKRDGDNLAMTKKIQCRNFCITTNSHKEKERQTRKAKARRIVFPMKVNEDGKSTLVVFDTYLV
jgi:hypothetical protein